MILYETIARIASLVVLITFAILLCRKLGIQVYKGKAATGAIAIGVPVVIHTIVFNILEKNLGWFPEPVANTEVVQDIVPEPVTEESTQLAEDDCCGGTEEEREAFKGQLNEAWILPDESDRELQEVLPPPNILALAEATFQSEDIALSPKEEPEIDWDATRLAMLKGAEATGGQVSKAMAAEMMLEADQFMETMGEADAIAIAERTQEIWNQMAPNLPEHLITGTNAIVWRKTFEIQAAVEQSIFAEEKVFWEEEHQMISREMKIPEYSEAD